jgi:hypothetical protein
VNVEILKSFQKDALKLPAPIEVQLATAMTVYRGPGNYQNYFPVRNCLGLEMLTE